MASHSLTPRQAQIISHHRICIKGNTNFGNIQSRMKKGLLLYHSCSVTWPVLLGLFTCWIRPFSSLPRGLKIENWKKGRLFSYQGRERTEVMNKGGLKRIKGSQKEKAKRGMNLVSAQKQSSKIISCRIFSEHVKNRFRFRRTTLGGKLRRT